MDTGGARRGNCSAMLVRKYVLFGKDSEKWLGRCAGEFNSAPLHVFSAWLSSVTEGREGREAQRSGLAWLEEM